MSNRATAVPVSAGFIPLIDSAILIAAAEQGFAADEGIALRLVRETSWANIRDKISVGHLDVAHMLAPMPIASNLGLTPLPAKLIAPMALGTGGNTITVSMRLWAEIEQSRDAGTGDPAALAAALSNVVKERAARGARPLSFGIVHPHSSHHYELAYVLGHAGIRPGVDVALVVVPPMLMPDALAEAQIDGFSAGEPWGTIAVASGAGRIATTKSAIWLSSPEKVLGLRSDWADTHQDQLAGLIRALYRAAAWCDDGANRDALIAMLAERHHLGVEQSALRSALEGAYAPHNSSSTKGGGSIFRFSTPAASFPWQSHALWFYSQMVRWGQCSFQPENLETVRRTFRPDVYRAALDPMGVALPSANAKVEGALKAPTPVGSARGRLVLGPDGFFDGRIFDPDHVPDYIAGFKVSDAAR